MSETFEAKNAATTAAKAGQQTAEAMADASRNNMKAVAEAVGTMNDAARTASERAGEAVAAGAERSRQSMAAATDYGRTMTQSFQQIAEAWTDYARTGAERSMERMNALLAARTPVDVISAQRDLLLGGVEDLMGAQRRIGEISMQMMGDVTGKLSAGAPTQRFAA